MSFHRFCYLLIHDTGFIMQLTIVLVLVGGAIGICTGIAIDTSLVKYAMLLWTVACLILIVATTYSNKLCRWMRISILINSISILMMLCSFVFSYL